MIMGLLHEAGRLLQQVWYLIPMGVVGFISWTVWLIRWTISHRYRPLVNDFHTTTSVVVPSYREDPDVLERCLKSWLSEQPDELILVVDLDDTAVLERLTTYSDPCLRVIPFKHEGKRSALAVGIRAARYDVVVLTDSDTAWEPGLLAAVQMPFVDPQVGGVGTRQNAFERQSSIWRVIADWAINTRYLDYVPAQGMAGGVSCLSGRTAAYRRSVIAPMVDDLEYEYFLGRLCVAGDDGRLTWLVLAAGYKTVYQSTARAWSMFPETFRAFVKQRTRWSRNSYRCYLTAMYHGWLWRQPLMTQLTVFQIMATPISMFFGLSAITAALLHQHWGTVEFGIVWLLVGRAIRSISHLREHPKDIVWLPLDALIVIFIALPVKTWAAISMNRQGWLTRTSNRLGGEGQTEASLYRDTGGGAL